VALTLFASPGLFNRASALPNSSCQGTMRVAAKAALVAAKASYDCMSESFYAGRDFRLYPAFRWSRRRMAAEIWINPQQRAAAARANLDRTNRLYQHAKKLAATDSYIGIGPDYYLADAQVLAITVENGNPAAFYNAAGKRASAALAWYEERKKGLEYLLALGREPWGEPSELFTLLDLARLWIEAELVAREKQPERFAAAELYQDRVKGLDQMIRAGSVGLVTKTALTTGTYFLKDAEILVAKHSQPPRQMTPEIADQVRAAQWIYTEQFKRDSEPGQGMASVEWYYQWSGRWRDATLALAPTRSDAIAAAEAHLTRMRELRKLFERRTSSHVPEDYALAMDFYHAEAEYLLAETKAK
jgi:hypothetical protein